MKIVTITLREDSHKSNVYRVEATKNTIDFYIHESLPAATVEALVCREDTDVEIIGKTPR